MRKYEKFVAERFRLNSRDDFESTLNFFKKMSDIWVAEFKDMLVSIDYEALDAGLVPRINGHTFLENKGRCGSTPDTPYSRNVLSYLTRKWEKFDSRRPYPAKVPIHRLIGWPWEFTLDRATNMALTAFIIICFTSFEGEDITDDLVSTLQPYFGKVITTYLHRYSDGASEGYVGIGSQLTPGSSVNWKAAEWAHGKRICTKGRRISAINKGFLATSKPASGYLKEQFPTIPSLVADRSSHEKWNSDTLNLMNKEGWIGISNDMSNYDANMLGYNATHRIFDFLEEKFSFPSYLVKRELLTPSYLPWNGQWIGVTGNDGLSSGSTFTTDVGKLVAIERLTKQAFVLRYIPNSAEMTCWQIDEVIDALPYEKFTKLMDNVMNHNYSYLDMSDDSETRTNLIPGASEIPDLKKRAEFGADYMTKHYWSKYDASLTTESGLSFLGQAFTDSKFKANPYKREWKSIGRMIVKILVDEDPKLGKLSIVSLCARVLQLSDQTTFLLTTLRKINSAATATIKLLLSMEHEPGHNVRVRQYSYLSAVASAAAIAYRHCGKGGSAALSKLMTDTAMAAVKDDGSELLINNLLQTFLKGSDDASLLPDELQGLLPYLYADLKDVKSLKILERLSDEEKDVEIVRFATEAAKEIMKSKKARKEVYLSKCLDGFLKITEKLVANKMIVWHRGAAAS